MKKILSVFIIFLLLPCCYYNDSEIFETTIEPPVTPPINITSNLDGFDSLGLSDSLYFEYNIDYDTGRVYYSQLYLGNKIFFQSDTTYNELWIKPLLFMPTGLHKLGLEVYYKSYTGSLADILNSEPRFIDTTWQIVVYDD